MHPQGKNISKTPAVTTETTHLHRYHMAQAGPFSKPPSSQDPLGAQEVEYSGTHPPVELSTLFCPIDNPRRRPITPFRARHLSGLGLAQ
jgi:hypothetical protein